MEQGLQTAQLVVAILLVSVFAWFRFNTPDTARSETTWSKFLIGRTIYVAIILAILLAILSSPAILAPMTKGVWPGVDIEQVHKELALPLIAALILTIFLSEIPFLRKLDESLRGYFHRIASVPKEHRQRSHFLSKASLRVTDEVEEKVLARFDAQGLDIDSLVLEDQDSPEGAWTRLTVHAVCLEKLEKDAKYADHIARTSGVLGFRDSYNRLADKAKHVFPLLRQQSNQKATGLLRQEFTEQAQELLFRLYDHASRMILSFEKTERQRQECVERLGLQASQARWPLPIHEFIWLSVLIALILSVAIAVVRGEVLPRLLDILSITLTLCASTVVSVSVHSHSNYFRPPRVPPIGRYLVAGLLAALVWLMIRSGTELVKAGELFQLFRVGKSDAWISFLIGNWPWMLVASSIGVIVAVLTDPWSQARIGRFREKWSVFSFGNAFDALTMSIVLGLVGYFGVFNLLDDPPGSSPWIITLTVSGIGLAIGFFFPHYYRNRIGKAETIDPEFSGS